MEHAIRSGKLRKPVLEHDSQRGADLGYDPAGQFGFIRCLEHGAPNPLIRWHYHEDYELHLIVKTSGKVFVGDYIGRFTPGQLVLTGPHLPHNWISTDLPPEGVAIRDCVVQFPDAPLRQASQWLPEIHEVLPLLERARHGIEFIGFSEQAQQYMQRIRYTVGLERLAIFFNLMADLAKYANYKLLSTARLQSFDNSTALQQISTVVDYITAHYAQPFSLTEIAQQVSMSESQLSRAFRRTTGNTFTDFVNRLRINRACQLLMETEQYVSTICYNVGFNNIANFNRRFMEIKGMTPSEFRHQGADRFG